MFDQTRVVVGLPRGLRCHNQAVRAAGLNLDAETGPDREVVLTDKGVCDAGRDPAPSGSSFGEGVEARSTRKRISQQCPETHFISAYALFEIEATDERPNADPDPQQGPGEQVKTASESGIEVLRVTPGPCGGTALDLETRYRSVCAQAGLVGSAGILIAIDRQHLIIKMICWTNVCRSRS